jgi:hypothetical protein
MSIWNWFSGMFSGDGTSSSTDLGSELSSSHAGCDINPATGLPMVGGCGGVDVHGNPYGADINEQDALSDVSSTDTSSWDGTSSTFDDTWNTTTTIDDSWNNASTFDDSWNNTSSFDDPWS